MGVLERIIDGKIMYEVSRRLPPNKLGLKRFRRYYSKAIMAKKVLEKLNGAIALGNLDVVLPGLVGHSDPDYTVATFYERFEREYCKPRMSSWYRYRQSFGFIISAVGQIPLRDFRRVHLHQYLETRTKSVSQSTANRDIAALKKMFSYAVEVGALEFHPLAGFSSFRVQEKALRLPTLEEFYALVEAQPTPQLRALVAILGETGMRKSEGLDLTWPNVDLRNKRVMAEKTKGKKVRSLPLSDYAIEKLRALTRIVGNQNVFVYDYGSYSGKKIRKPYKAYRAAAESVGLGWVTFHTLRHLRGTSWLQHGADIRDVQLGLGHASIQTTMRYLKHTETHVDRSLRGAQEVEKKELVENLKREKSGRREE